MSTHKPSNVADSLMSQANEISALQSRVKQLEEALRPIIDALGYAEWATPEHAEEILRDLIRKHHGPARALINGGSQ